MKQGWEIKKLGEVCEFQNGFAFKSKTYKESGLPILRITNIQNESLDTKELVYFETKDYKENLDRFKVYSGDLVIAMSGATTGKIGINTSDTVFYLNQRVGKFTPKKSLNKSFLYYFLSTKVEESLRIAAGAAQPNLSTEQILNFEIPLPPLPEQQRIVSILDEAFAAIDKAKANAEQNLKNAKVLFESYLQEVFGPSTRSRKGKRESWEVKNLGEVANTNGRIGWRGLTAKEYTEQGPLFLSVHSLNYGDYVDFKDAFHISQERYDESPEIMLQKDDILICKDGAGIGKLGIIPDLPDFATINSSLLLIRCKSSVLTKYLYYNLLSPFFQSIVNSRLSGATTPHLYQRDIVTFPILLPSKTEQQTIVHQLDSLRAETQKLETIYQKKLTDLEELKKSILQKAFAGELG